jgi:hypothetical protein
MLGGLVALDCALRKDSEFAVSMRDGRGLAL